MDNLTASGPLAYSVFALILLGVLARLAWIDFKTYRLPNVLTFPLIFLGLVQSHILSQSLTASQIGAAIGYGLFVAIELGFKRLRKIDGLGRGDAKLLAAGGAWCGWAGLPFIVLIASGGGLIYALLMSKGNDAPQKDTLIPFGPFLATGIAMVWLCSAYVAFNN